MIYGLIISAGKQTRFNTDTPKALMPYKNTTLLDTNIANLQTVCDEVIVVCSFENAHWFENYPTVAIQSGKGCGHAVMRALECLELEDDDTVFVQWGDSLQTTEIYQQMIDNYNESWIIPCTVEDNPYVQIVERSEDSVSVLFSKYNEQTTRGFHDLSVFYGNAVEMRSALEEMDSLINVSGQYVHKHGNELVFLDVFNETSIPVQIISIAHPKTFAFNTLEEFVELNTDIS